MHDLRRLGVDDLYVMRDAIGAIAERAGSLEEAAQGVVEHLRTSLQADGPGVALARLYLTVPHRSLPDELGRRASAAADGPLDADAPCLVLLGTSGVEQAWCDRRRSERHQVIPLRSAAAVSRAPMVAGLLDGIGVDVEELLEPAGRQLRHHVDREVFHVLDARDAPTIPDQAGFVAPYGIRTVIGFGGFLPSGALFAVVLFLTTTVDATRAGLFRTVALITKAALVPLVYRVFSDGSSGRR